MLSITRAGHSKSFASRCVRPKNF